MILKYFCYKNSTGVIIHTVSGHPQCRSNWMMDHCNFDQWRRLNGVTYCLIQNILKLSHNALHFPVYRFRLSSSASQPGVGQAWSFTALFFTLSSTFSAIPLVFIHFIDFFIRLSFRCSSSICRFGISADLHFRLVFGFWITNFLLLREWFKQLVFYVAVSVRQLKWDWWGFQQSRWKCSL